jgi:hypothetical protein
VPRFLQPWVHWDSYFYGQIAATGYSKDTYAVFFPLYPALMSGLSRLTGIGVYWVGFIISTAALLLSGGLLASLVRREGHDDVWPALLVLLAFPGALFLAAVYTESLFLLLTVLCFYLVRRGWWGWAGLVGFFAAMSRYAGAILAVVLAIELYQNRAMLKSKAAWGVVALPVLGFLSYAAYCWQHYGDPLMFARAQVYFGRSIEYGPLSQLLDQGFHPHVTFINAIKAALTAGVLAGTVWLGLKTRRSYFWYCVLAVAASVLTLPTTSLIRYVAVLFPLHMAGADLAERHGLLDMVLVVLAMFLGMTTLLFAANYWVA